jgi:hypothetical protein
MADDWGNRQIQEGGGRSVLFRALASLKVESDAEWLVERLDLGCGERSDEIGEPALLDPDQLIAVDVAVDAGVRRPHDLR